MTATDELRRMLDERGVEYRKLDFKDGEQITYITSYDVDGHEFGYSEFPDSGTLLRIWEATPKQAIDATLGAGTCHEVMIDKFFRGCSECEYMWEYMYSIGKRVGPSYCPECGAKVVVECSG